MRQTGEGPREPRAATPIIVRRTPAGDQVSAHDHFIDCIASFDDAHISERVAAVSIARAPRAWPPADPTP